MKDFGIALDDDQAQTILAYFDRDRSGTVNYDEFLRALRVSKLHVHKFIRVT